MPPSQALRHYRSSSELPCFSTRYEWSMRGDGKARGAHRSDGSCAHILVCGHYLLWLGAEAWPVAERTERFLTCPSPGTSFRVALRDWPSARKPKVVDRPGKRPTQSPTHRRFFWYLTKLNFLAKIFCLYSRSCGRHVGYEPEGREFESLRAHHRINNIEAVQVRTAHFAYRKFRSL